jgi:hypothetical protein
LRASIVAKAERSEAARRKQTTGLTDDGLPVHSFESLLADLATYARIQATTALNDTQVGGTGMMAMTPPTVCPGPGPRYIIS